MPRAWLEEAKVLKHYSAAMDRVSVLAASFKAKKRPGARPGEEQGQNEGGRPCQF